MAIFDFIRVQIPYTDKSMDLCMDIIKLTIMKNVGWAILLAAAVTLASCEVLDDDIDKHTAQPDSTYIQLNEVTEILASLPLTYSQISEVHMAVTSSLDNGYDEEYTMRDLFESPGRGVGEDRFPSTRRERRAVFESPLREMIQNHVKQKYQTKSGLAEATDAAEAFLDALTISDVQIYWPFSEDWDGETMPVITFDPEDGSDVNIGYRLLCEDDGTRRVEEVVVDEALALEVPVWVVNRNSDAEFTSLEMLRREDPNWGEGGGSIIIKPGQTKASSGESPCRTLILKDFTMNRNYDSWFAGASEFFVKTGSVDDFTASTEAELRLFNPLVTDFMIVVKRNQVGKPQPFNAVLVSDWNPQMTHCAFMITEDDGGTITEWKCTALVRIASKSYGVEINLPFNSRDDIVWRGQLTSRWFEANNNLVGHFGDVDMTFEIVEY